MPDSAATDQSASAESSPPLDSDSCPPTVLFLPYTDKGNQYKPVDPTADPPDTVIVELTGIHPASIEDVDTAEEFSKNSIKFSAEFRPDTLHSGLPETFVQGKRAHGALLEYRRLARRALLRFTESFVETQRSEWSHEGKDKFKTAVSGSPKAYLEAIPVISKQTEQDRKEYDQVTQPDQNYRRQADMIRNRWQDWIIDELISYTTPEDRKPTLIRLIRSPINPHDQNKKVSSSYRRRHRNEPRTVSLAYGKMNWPSNRSL